MTSKKDDEDPTSSPTLGDASASATGGGGKRRVRKPSVMRSMGSGGRAPRHPSMASLEQDAHAAAAAGASARAPPDPSEARLDVIQITDVYTLANFASLKTLIADKRRHAPPGSKVISVCTGDFLAPYLLSSIDKGAGMMKAMARTPVDYLTWGNHEADIEHRVACKHVRNFPGIWLNTNMQDHEAMESQRPFDIIEVTSEDGTNRRRIGLVAVLSNDPALYSHFDEPGAFGGAKIDDPWETLRKYKELLEGPEYNCDVVIPLQHLYVPDDHRTCREFDFPVILSGHDHHRVDEVVEGTRLIKPGLDGIYATSLDLTWPDATTPRNEPEVHATFCEVGQWEPDEELEEECERAYDALAPMRDTELARVPPQFEPLSSANSRGSVTTMGRLVCSLIRSALNNKRQHRQLHVDAVVLMGGNIRGGKDYPPGSFFSLEALEAEIKSDEDIAIMEMPGRVLAEGIAATHSGDPIPGWCQFDEGVKETTAEDGSPQITHVAGKPIDLDGTYRIATKISDLTNGQSPPFTEYYTAHPGALPPSGAYANIHAELMSYFAKNLWRKLWEAIGGCTERPGDLDPHGRFKRLDRDGNGTATIDDIQNALRDLLGLSVHDSETALAECVHDFADYNGNGVVTVEDFELLCTDLEFLYETDAWRLNFPRKSVLFTLSK